MALSKSQQMARIRSKDTKPEIVLRKALWAKGLRYRVNHPRLPGKPDVAILGPRVCVFLDGCFWHGCPDHYVFPRSRQEYWSQKLLRNVQRDRNQTRELEDLGWTVLRIWEHELRGKQLQIVVTRVLDAVNGSETSTVAEDWRVERVEPLEDRGNLERRVLSDLRDPELRRVTEGPRNTRSR